MKLREEKAVREVKGKVFSTQFRPKSSRMGMTGGRQGQWTPATCWVPWHHCGVRERRTETTGVVREVYLALGIILAIWGQMPVTLESLVLDLPS